MLPGKFTDPNLCWSVPHTGYQAAYQSKCWECLLIMLTSASALLVLQGFASGDLEKDATAVRMCTDAGVELLLSQVHTLVISAAGKLAVSLAMIAAF